MTRSERKRFWRWLRKHNCSKQYAFNFYNYDDTSRPAQPLMDAFRWSATPEGSSFWSKRHGMLFEDEGIS